MLERYGVNWLICAIELNLEMGNGLKLYETFLSVLISNVKSILVIIAWHQKGFSINIFSSRQLFQI